MRRTDGFCRWPDEYDPSLHRRLGEIGVLRKEPVARVDGLCATGLGGGDDFVPAQVALGRGVAANMVGLISHTCVHCVCVSIGVHRDRAYAEPARRRENAAGYLAAVRDQDLVEWYRGIDATI
eukprot:SAG11_NODE_3897_length_2159_cov_1.950000_1_plen_123_part_00